MKKLTKKKILLLLTLVTLSFASTTSLYAGHGGGYFFAQFSKFFKMNTFAFVKKSPIKTIKGKKDPVFDASKVDHKKSFEPTVKPIEPMQFNQLELERDRSYHK